MGDKNMRLVFIILAISFGVGIFALKDMIQIKAKYVMSIGTIPVKPKNCIKTVFKCRIV
jgi:hypothetical protein